MQPDLEAGVRQIVEARARGATLAGLTAAQRPRTFGDAYRMQAAAIAQWNDKVVGWKIGATNKDLHGISEPFYGPIFQRNVVQSPARLRARDFQHRILETEFAFRLDRSLPSRELPYSRDEVAAAIGALIPAFEVVSPRFAKLPTHDPAQLIADFGGNGAAVLGTPCQDWRSYDLPPLKVSFSIGGTVIQQGVGLTAFGHALNVLQWFANTRRAQGFDVAAGQFVMTGTMTGLHAPDPGQMATADLGPLGTLEVVFD